MIAEDPARAVQAAVRRPPGERPRAALGRRAPAWCCSTCRCPDSHGLETFAKVYAHSPTVPIIVLTGNDDQTLALSAVKGGAQDYLVKGRLDRELLLRSMQYSIERKRYQVQLEHQANYDALTGLPNRNLLHDRLRQAVYAQRMPRADRGGVHRPRPLQVRQRLARPLHRRRAAARRMAERLRSRAARGRHRGAPGRRRVRADPERPVERGGDLPRHAAHHAPRSAEPIDDRRQGALRHLQRRHQPLPAGRARRRDAAQERRRGDVPRQGARPQQLPVLHLGDERARERAPRARDALRRALERQRAPAALPAAASTCAPARSSAPRRWCAGSIRSGAWCARRASSRSPRRPASSCRSASGCCARPAARRAPGTTPASQPGVVSVNLSARQFRAGRPGAHGVARPRGDAARPGAASSWSSPRAW